MAMTKMPLGTLEIKFHDSKIFIHGNRLNRRRAPDNFLKQGVADASLEAKSVFQQNP